MKTKKEAAGYLGKSEKAIERLVAAGTLDKIKEPKPGGGFITYYDDDQLRALRQHSDDAQTEELELIQNGASLALRRTDIVDQRLARVLAGVIEARDRKPRVDVKDRQFLTEREAAALAGLTIAYIKWAVRDKKLRARRLPHVRGKRIARAELDAHLKTLELEEAAS